MHTRDSVRLAESFVSWLCVGDSSIPTGEYDIGYLVHGQEAMGSGL